MSRRRNMNNKSTLKDMRSDKIYWASRVTT